MRYLAILFILLFPICAVADDVVLGRYPSSVVGGAIGSTNASGSTDYFSNYIFFTQYQTTTAGTIGYAHIRVLDGNGANTYLRLHDSSGNVLLVCSGTASNDTDGWENFACTGTYNIQASTPYLLSMVNVSANSRVYRDATASWGIDVDSTYSGNPQDEDPIGKTADKTSYDLVIYFDNSPGSPN